MFSFFLSWLYVLLFSLVLRLQKSFVTFPAYWTYYESKNVVGWFFPWRQFSSSIETKLLSSIKLKSRIEFQIIISLKFNMEWYLIFINLWYFFCVFYFKFYSISCIYLSLFLERLKQVPWGVTFPNYFNENGVTIFSNFLFLNLNFN